MSKYSVIDLFAGAGGLSLGFLQTGLYDIKVAFENNPNMQETYRRNHQNVDVRDDVCAADYGEIIKEYGSIDVVIGGPPCQGFSNANRQKNHAISQNNMLVKQFIRAIIELKPKAFVMENVSMLRSDVHRFYLDEADVQLIEHYNIPMTQTRLVLLDKTFMFEEALEIVQNPERIANELWTDEQYSILNVIYKASKNPQKMLRALEKHKKALLKYAEEISCCDAEDAIKIMTANAFETVYAFYEGRLNKDKIKDAIEPAIMVQRMLKKAKEIIENRLVIDKYDSKNGLSVFIKSYAVFDYLKAILESTPNNYMINANILCAADFGAPQKRMRFVVMGIKKELVNEVIMPKGTFTESSYRTVRDAIEDLESVPTVVKIKDDIGTPITLTGSISELGNSLRNTGLLYNHIITNTTDTAMQRFKALKPGQNFHSLDESLKINTYSDVSRTQNTIYLRLDYDQPCGTVVNVRKSMWIHPKLDRAISVREAARLQTFPDSFVFCGTKDKQYQQVGNAVPPIMAKQIAFTLASQLDIGISNKVLQE